MKKEISSIFALAVVLILSIFVGGYAWVVGHSIEYFPLEQENFFAQRHAVTGESLMHVVAKVYSNPVYSNNKTSCLSQYVKFDPNGPEGNEQPFDFDNICPVTRGLDIASNQYSEATIGALLSYSEFLNNPGPITKYLALERSASSTKEYSMLYSAFVIAQSLKQKLSLGDTEEVKSVVDNLSLFDTGETQGGNYVAYQTEVMSVATTTDLVLVEDIASSGAYNIYGTLYQVVFKPTTLIVRPATILDTSPKGVKNFDQNGTSKHEHIDGLVNGYFDMDHKIFGIYGFSSYSLYPCNKNYKYTFYEDRLIHVSTTEAKDCKKYPNIGAPDSIPNDFDSSPIEIYKISPEVLQEAMKFKI